MGRRRGTSAFPVARIKKMMQSDDDVGKIATVTPVLVAKALECMMEHVLREAAAVAHQRRTKTVTPQHLKFCVANNDTFDFLRATLADIPSLDDAPPPPQRRPRSRSAPATPTVPSARPKRPRSPLPADPLPTLPPLPLPPLQKRPRATEAAPAPSATLAQPADDDDDDYDDDHPDDAHPHAPQPPSSPSDNRRAIAAAAYPNLNPFLADADAALPVLPVQPLPVFAQPVVKEGEEGKAAERVSVHALLS